MKTSKINKLILIISIIFIVNIISIGTVNATQKVWDKTEAKTERIQIARYILANENQKIKSKYPNWTILTTNESSELDKNGDKKVDKNDLIKVKRHIVAMENNAKKKEHPDWIIYIEQEVLSEKVTLNKNKLTLERDKTEKLNATITPTNATNKNVTWSSSDTGVATVDSTGKVTAKKAGTATITVKTNNGKTYNCKVTVTEPVTSVKLNKNTTTIYRGNSEKLTVTITPTNATNKTVTWSSSNTGVATVDSTGKVTAKKAGTATITAKTSNGKNYKCTVTVTEPVTHVTLNKVKTTLYMGKTETLKATVTPTNATNKNITWSSSDTSIATVDSTGKVTPKKDGGPVIITATTQNGKTATCEIKVVNVTADISLDRTVLMIDDYHYNYADLKASVIQSNGKDITENYKIKWSSSNAQVAKVYNKGSGKGRVKGLSYGTSKITASVTINGVTKTATCKLRVIAPVTEKIDNYSRIIDEKHPITNIRYRGSWSDTFGKTWYLVNGSWGNSYVEAYVNNAAKLVKDSLKDNSLKKYKSEASQKTIWCYKQNDLNIRYDTNNKKITTVSGTQYGSTICPMYNSNFTESSKTKAKGELSPNNYLVLFTSKNQWMYLLKKNSKTNEWNVITAKKSSGGYCINEFEDYMCIEFLNKELGVTFTYRYYSRGATTWQNSVHYDITGMTGVPTSGGCLHAGTYSSEMYYRICHDAGVGTRLILF